MNKHFSRLSSIGVNLIPIFGVLFFHWSAFTILFAYWCETGVIGVVNLLKIWKAQMSEEEKKEFTATASDGKILILPGQWARLAHLLKFVLIYGGFMVVHLVFLFFIGGILTTMTYLLNGNTEGLNALSGPHVDFTGWLFAGNGITLASFIIMVLGFFVIHGFSFLENYLGKKEYLHVTVTQQLMSPFKRVIVMQVTIIFGAFFFGIIPYAGGIILVILKILLDTRIFKKENEKNGIPVETSLLR